MNSQSASNPPLVEKYRYNCIDDSILLPPFKKYYVSLYFQWIPHSLTANWITLISSSAMWIMLYLAFHSHQFQFGVLAFLFAFLLHFYVVGDHLDGMQAKHTGTSSALGEFLDHYFDIYNSAITLAAAFALMEINNPWLFYSMIWLSYQAFAATMMEQKERGELYFGFVGSLEGVVIILLFFISCIPLAGRNFWQSPLWEDYPRYWIIIGIGALGLVVTVLDILKRLKYSPRQYNLFFVGSLLLIWVLSSSSISLAWGWLLLASYTGDYAGRVMCSYLVSQKHPYPDLLATALIAILFINGQFGLIPTSWDESLIVGLGIYIASKNIWSFVRIIRKLSKDWMWFNPKNIN